MSDGGCVTGRGCLELGLSICKPVPAGSCQNQLRGGGKVPRTKRCECSDSFSLCMTML